MNDMEMRPCGNGYMYCDGRCVYCKYVSYNTTNTSNTTVKKIWTSDNTQHRIDANNSYNIIKITYRYLFVTGGVIGIRSPYHQKNKVGIYITWKQMMKLGVNIHTTQQR